MSLILDALRKSESERRRGQVPDLRAELPPIVHATASPRRAWPLWFAGGALLLAATALAWSQWASRQPPPARTTVAAPAVAPVTARASDPASKASAAAPIAATTQPARSPAPATPATRDPEPAAPARDEARLAAEPAQAADLPMPAPATPPPPPDAKEPSGPVPAPAQASMAALLSPPASDPVRLGDLSPGEREQLPALKISMHMWGPTPAQRFAIIDGARVGQGDRVGDAVVEQIAADGVVLNWHGRRVSLSLR